MALPLILGLLGSTLGAGTTLGAIGAGALGSGLGRFAETGDFEEGVKTGLASFVGGQALGTLGKAFGGTGIPAGETTRKIADFGMGGVNPQSFGQNFMSTLKDPISFGQAAIAQGTVPPPPVPEMEDVEFDNRERMAPDRIMRRPPPGYRPGFDPEFDYRVAPNYGTRVMSAGGELQNPDKADLDDDGQISSYERKRGLAIEKSMAEQGANMGGLVGLLGFSGGGELKPIPEDNKGLPNLPKDVRNKMGFMQEGGMAEMPDDMDGETIMINAIMALQGMSSDPEQDLMEFISAFGMDALQDLQRRVAMGEMGGGERGVGRLVEGMGDGMSDSVDAEIVNDMSDPSGSGQPLKVADGEYVIAADAVADIGNGSTDAGAKKLDALMKQVRMARHGTTKQPPERDMMAVMKRAIT
tara:strand:+ start:1062 stop:2297 length:1236 start_codon:yes stop_codon:yes gene_type:complete